MEVDLTTKAKKFFKYGLIGVAGLAVASAGAAYYMQSREVTMKIYGAEVAGSMVGVRAMAAGKIETLPVENGAAVDSGNVIATISVKVSDEELAQLEETVRLAEQNLAQVQAGRSVRVPVTRSIPRNIGGGVSYYDVEAAQSAVASAGDKLERFRSLADIGAIPQNQLWSAQAEYDSAVANLNSVENRYYSSEYTYDTETIYEIQYQDSPPEVIASAEISLKQAESALASAKQEATATEITAPIAGNFYPVNIELGTDVKPGQIIAQIGDTSDLWIEAKITDEQMQKLQLGQLVNYELNGQILEGNIIEFVTPDSFEEDEEDVPIQTPAQDQTQNPVQNPVTDNQSNAWIPPERNQPTQPIQTQDQNQPQNQPTQNQNAWIPPNANDGKWIPPEQNQTQQQTQPLTQDQNQTQPQDQSQPQPQSQDQTQLQQNQSIIEGNSSDEFEYVEEEVFNPEPKIRVSIPKDLPFECKPGMKSVIIVRMN